MDSVPEYILLIFFLVMMCMIGSCFYESACTKNDEMNDLVQETQNPTLEA